jgi:hypothetical protein
LPETFWQTGTLDVIRAATIMEKHSMTGDRILPMVIGPELAVDIDDPVSLAAAEAACRAYFGSGDS